MSRAMKDSGIPWIGEIPSHWEVCRIKDKSNLFTGNSLNEQQKEYYSQAFDEDTIPYISTKDITRDVEGINYENGLSIPVNDNPFSVAPPFSPLLCVEGGSAGKKIGFTDRAVSFVNKLCCFDTRNVPRFQYYFVLSHAFNEPFSQNLQGIIGGVSVNVIKNLPQILPPTLEQQVIADILDKKCGEIDEMITLQERIIEELKAYKQSLITEIVCKGLSPDVPMKDSGIGWIGQIPEKWEITRVKWLLQERKERSVNGKEEPLSMSQKLGLVPTKDMDIVPNMASSYEGAKLVCKGDLVFNKLKAHLGVFSTSNYDGLVSPDYAVYYATGRANVEYLEFLFKTPQCIGEFKKRITGVASGLSRLYTDDLFSIYCPIPPLEEQERIIGFLREKKVEIDTLISLKQSKIDALKEYKKSIIYEYVTGKKEI